jgi:hypothetical protein
MSKTPLRQYLDSIGKTAETFAAEHRLSPWSVRHWTRGNKIPALQAQIDLKEATGGLVTPESWLAWSLAQRGDGAELAKAS